MNPEERPIIGIDLGGTKIHVATVDADGVIVSSARARTPLGGGPEPVIREMVELISVVTKGSGAEIKDLAGICVGVPGAIDDDQGLVEWAPNLEWRQVSLTRLLQAALGHPVPVFLGNDVEVAVLGEHTYGCGRGTGDFLGVFVGTGIGGGIIIDGALYTGARHAAGEVGHVILKKGGPRCSCGNRGCAEALASRTAMERQVKKLIKKGRTSIIPDLLSKSSKPRLTSSVIAQALAKDDKVMTRVFRKAQHTLGLLVASLINVLDPEIVVIGGGLCERLGEEMVGPIRQVAYDHLLLKERLDQVKIEPTILRDRAAPIGAAVLARQRLLVTGTTVHRSQAGAQMEIPRH
jgi:glucokinase